MNDNSKTAASTTQTAVKHSAKVVEQHSKKIADSAKELKTSTAAIETSADRTTELAADRTILAAERTYAAWVRTGLFALASGIGTRALLTGVVPEWIILANGSVLILFSVFCFAAAIWRQLHPGPPPPVPDVKRMPRSLLATMNVFLALVSVVALIGIWAHTPR
jgi:putative membrane protein